MGGVTSMFSSPSKQAQAAASAQQGLSQQAIAQAEQYANQTATNEQNAIANVGANPYFGAAAQMNPGAYTVNPQNTVTFGSSTVPGITNGSPFAVASPQSTQVQNSTRTTLPVASNANAQSTTASPERTTAPTTSTQATNPFANGKHNTEALAALFGL
jgi:hypothetical protein